MNGNRFQTVQTETELMGSDAPPEMFEESKGVYVSLQFNDPVEVERIFNALTENGKVQMLLEETFWAERFAILVDRFGTPCLARRG